MTPHVQITFASTFQVDIAFRCRIAFFNWRLYVLYCLLIHIDWIAFFKNSFVQIFPSHCVLWSLRHAKIRNALTRHVNGLTFSQKFAVHIFKGNSTHICYILSRFWTSSEYVYSQLLYHQNLLIISCGPFPFCISFKTKRQR